MRTLVRSQTIRNALFAGIRPGDAVALGGRHDGDAGPPHAALEVAIRRDDPEKTRFGIGFAGDGLRLARLQDHFLAADQVGAERCLVAVVERKEVRRLERGARPQLEQPHGKRRRPPADVRIDVGTAPAQ